MGSCEMKVTGTTRLSELRDLVNDPRKTDGCVNPRMVSSIQQSLAAEGHVFSEEYVREVLERLERAQAGGPPDCLT